MPEAKIHQATDRANQQVEVPLLAGTRKAAQRYVDKIVSSDWWLTNGLGYDEPTGPPPHRIWVREDPSEYAAGTTYFFDHHYHRGELLPFMVLGRGDYIDGREAIRDPWVILHELAHLRNAHVQDRGSHGPQFVYSFHALVHQWLGPQASSALRAAAKDLRIRVNYSLLQSVA